MNQTDDLFSLYFTTRFMLQYLLSENMINKLNEIRGKINCIQTKRKYKRCTGISLKLHIKSLALG